MNDEKIPVPQSLGLTLTLMEDFGLDVKRDKIEPKERSGLKVGDQVILKPESAHKLYDGFQFNKENYKQIHQGNLKGDVINLGILNDHYCFGEYATIKWENGYIDESIHTSWLQLKI